ncbi:MAG: tripartite tricarboxylate transporter substrate binding protein [Brevinema sp.]
MKWKFILLALFMGFSACTQETTYPSKNITLIVPFASGGGTDSIARILAKTMESILGQNIVIENRAGGSGAVGMTTGSKVKNDGYTITMITRELITLPLLGLAPINKNDFELVGLVNLDPTVILVKGDSPYQTYQELAIAIKNKPNQITFASTAKPNYYVGAFELATGLKLKQIPFNGAGEAIPAVLGGHTEVTMVGPGEALSQIQNGQLKALAVMNDTRINILSDVPTLKELGVNVSTGTWRGLAVPLETPQEIIDLLSSAVASAITNSQFVQFMTERGYGIHYKDPSQLAEFLLADEQSFESVIDFINRAE